MMRISYNKYSKGEWLFVTILLLVFITDSLNVIIFHGGFESLVKVTKYTKLSAYGKSLFLVSYIIYYTARNVRTVLTIGFVGLLFFLSSLIIYGVSEKGFVFTWFILFSKLILPLLLFDFLLRINSGYESVIFKTLLLIISIQTIIVFIAIVFDLNVFRTYGGSRFGFSGLLYAQNEATFYYALASLFTFKYWQNTQNRYILILLIGVFLSLFLLGTKSVFIFTSSFFVFLGFYYQLYRKSYFWIGGVVILVISSFFLYKLGVVEYYVSQANEKGWLYMITSMRNVLIAERLPVVFENWHWYNYLFGGVNPVTSFVEMDIIDLFLYGGIVGSLLYYLLLFKTIFSFSKNNYFGWFLVFQYFLIGGLAGHVFASGINAIYLAITSYYLQMSNGKSVE